MKDVFIKLESTTVYGKMAGKSADPLILGLHGWSQRNGWHTWEPLMAPLAKAGFCVASIDMPGWGKSPALGTQFLSAAQAVAVVMSILDSLAYGTAVLMGKSWGGGVAVKTALAHPQRVSKLLLTAPALRNFEQLRDLKQPVLLAWAEDDPVIPFAVSGRFVTAVAHSKLITYPTGGHSAAQNNATDFAAQAVDFLRV